MLAAISLFAAAMIIAAPPELTPPQLARAEKLQNSLMAPCCYAKTVAQETSDVALDMRAEIAQMVAAGKSDREILNFYKQRYGARILGEPEGATWWWAQIMPIVALIVGLTLVVHYLKKWHLRRPA